MLGPALCQASRRAAAGASHCSSGTTLLPIWHVVCSCWPPSAPSSSVQATLSLDTHGPCRAHTHTRFHCASAKPPLLRVPAQELPLHLPGLREQHLLKMAFPLTNTVPCRPRHSPCHPGPAQLCPHEGPQHHCHQIQPSPCSVGRKGRALPCLGSPDDAQR